MTRMPIVAGTFYDASPAACRAAVREMLEGAKLPEDTPSHIFGGLVPHAGWMCSGMTAALTFKAIASQWQGDTLVLLGAVHSYSGRQAMVYASGNWQTPLGRIAIDEDLANAMLSASSDLISDSTAHSGEHSLEVQLPLVQELWPQAKIVPVMVPPSTMAVGIGKAIGEVLASCGKSIPIIGSTDLTHYGPRYGITPGGAGKAGLDWAARNDRKLLSLVEQMNPERALEDTARTHSACGGGAIAATIEACRALGHTKARCSRTPTAWKRCGRWESRT